MANITGKHKTPNKFEVPLQNKTRSFFAEHLWTTVSESFHTTQSILQNLTRLWHMSLSYKIQSIDLLCKSMEWFLNDRNHRHERVRNEIKMILTFIHNCLWGFMIFVLYGNFKLSIRLFSFKTTISAFTFNNIV